MTRITVLAIWPDSPDLEPPLDQAGEASALYDAGIDYVALRGADATRDGVLREWARMEPDIVEIGAHGKDGQIFLTDGPTRPGWWGRLALDHQPRLIVLLACETSRSTMLDIPDALLRSGVQSVITVSDEIVDTDAVRFAKLFYQLYAEGQSIGQAFERARLAMSDEGAQMIRLRQSKQVASDFLAETAR